ncbi:TolC family outer membrane protein [Erwinia sp. 9145]|uniref:TolC family outer membrane protein n=1 Tax=Erwinia sp. 9145 TaxID=1500895 RepID=UPI0009E3A465|nr:TolC family outer membrane protein [Erwinia sp. 9145]
MKRLFLLSCWSVLLPFSAVGSPLVPEPASAMTGAAAGFWGAFYPSPTPGFAGGKRPDGPSNSPSEEIEMQPVPKDNHDELPGDWQSVIHLAVNQHPSISSSIAVLESTTFNIEAASAGYLPALTAGITSGRQQQEKDGQIATVGLSQMLYDFGKTGSAVDQASAKYLRQQATVLGQIDTIIQQTALTLNEVYRYRQLTLSAKEQVTSLRNILNLTRLRADAGASTRVDPVQAQARVEAAEAQQQELEIRLQQENYRLQSLLGRSIAHARIPAPGDLLPVIEGLGGRADLNKNPAIMVAQADVALAEAELRQFTAQRYPTLSLEANTNKYIGGMANSQSRNHYQNIFLSLNSTLYQGGAMMAQENAAIRALDAAKMAVNTRKMELTDQLRSTFQSMKGLQYNIKLLKKRMKTITETRMLYREQYLSLGNRNALDLLNAEQEIYRAEQDLINAERDLWASEVNYGSLSGMAREIFSFNGSVIQGLQLSQ